MQRTVSGVVQSQVVNDQDVSLWRTQGWTAVPLTPVNAATGMATYQQGPSDFLDYPFDWSRFLPAGDSITSSTWSTSPAGLSTSLPAIVGASMTAVWVTGGSPGSTYTLTNNVVTAAGRAADRSIVLSIQNL